MPNFEVWYFPEHKACLLEVSDVITLAVRVRSDLELNGFWVFGVDHLGQVPVELTFSRLSSQAMIASGLLHTSIFPASNLALTLTVIAQSFLGTHLRCKRVKLS